MTPYDSGADLAVRAALRDDVSADGDGQVMRYVLCDALCDVDDLAADGDGQVMRCTL